MNDYIIERSTVSTLDGRITDLTYKLFLVCKCGSKHQILNGSLIDLFNYFKVVHYDKIGELVSQSN